ncbi:LysE family translocator [Metabacillus malikii]|uniref:Threonine/homoserine/homoserine lactone efflux protein n=1 Tax=Metabacillus malikii TaxID=1504265 RepID=A0ABT9ZEA5_9BACI|nr:LysE family translocator [Metabacillus malikii]MDQ0230182.1 threonine/homoserine/homoserine lactone efflux protein [Metabacillus malikii]
MELVTILSFLGAAIALTLMPGPDNLFTLAQSIAKGKYAGIYTTLGLCTGLVGHITAAAIGISAVIYQSAFAFTVVKYAGAAYLLFLAYKSFRDKGSSFELRNEDDLDYKSLYKKGVIMNLLNPKVSLFFLAFFPQFISFENGNVSLQMLVLGSLFLVQTFVIFSLLSVFAGKVGEFLRHHPTLSKKINVIQGALFTFIGFKIVSSQK